MTFLASQSNTFSATITFQCFSKSPWGFKESKAYNTFHLVCSTYIRGSFERTASYSGNALDFFNTRWLLCTTSAILIEILCHNPKPRQVNARKVFRSIIILWHIHRLHQSEFSRLRSSVSDLKFQQLLTSPSSISRPFYFSFRKVF